ncbi:flagellin [Chromobacterium sp. IIBBL 290-4]|uniref:flagellin N-terminal helical domain-containing protein n=1 Tax=Chromobacterium sp. IIBBL 290-4 TaxID=2953890 RepID=UPI00273A619A|nr:flagellin [Chromobacterium sp. IIBBL 290-4]
MAITVNTNLSSLGAQLNLNNSSQMLNQSLQRLSSGLRINSAKDDAAGMAISQTLNSAIRGNNQAIRNANDGVSVGQTAEGALGQIANNLQRIREIAVQASNGGVSDQNRSQLQNEVDQLTREISRSIQTTEFNGTKLLQGGSKLTFQVGSKGQDDNKISIQTTNLAQAGIDPSKSATDLAALATQAKTDAATLETSYKSIFKTAPTNVNDAIVDTNLNTGVTMQRAQELQRGQLNKQNEYLQLDMAAKSKLVDDAEATIAKGGTVANIATLRGDRDTAKDALSTFTKSNPAIGTSSGLNTYNDNLSATKTVDITSQDAASKALSLLDKDIAQISDLRSTFGAVMNRFDAVVSNLSNYTQNLTAANSRIMDVDFASETANLTRNQILQQAGGAILKQSNSLPQAALSLLQ